MIKFDMSVFYVLFVALCLFAGTSADSRPRGTYCPAITTAQNFKQTEFMGTWYIYSASHPNREDDTKCIQRHWESQPNNVFAITTHSIRKARTKSSVIALVPKLDRPEQFEVFFYNRNELIHERQWILGTDYTSYAIAYTCRCRKSNKLCTEWAWITTRQPIPPESVINEALAVAATRGFNATQFIKKDQTGCEILDGKSNHIKSNPGESNQIASNPTESDPTASNPTKSHPTKSNSTESYPTESNPTESYKTESNSIQTDRVESNLIESHPTELNPMKSTSFESNSPEWNPVETNPTEANPIESNSVQLNPMKSNLDISILIEVN